VGDLDGVAEFYEEVVGLDVPDHAEGIACEDSD